MVVTDKQHVVVLQHGSKPLRCRNNFVDTNFTIIVGIHESQGLFVEFETFDRTAKHCPQFLVQFAKMSDIVARVDENTGNTTYGAKLPIVGILLCHNLLYYYR